MTVVAARLAGADLDDITASQFDDVQDGQWYTPYIPWAAKEGLIQGTGGNKFDPNRAITRAEMAIIIDRFITYMGYELPTVGEAAFTDISTSFAKDSILRLKGYGVISGYSEEIYFPNSISTRGENAAVTAQMIRVIMQALIEAGGI